jgi:hypothetical protein
MRLFLILLFVLFGTTTHTANAQIEGQGLAPQQLLEVSPEFPRPGEFVTVTLNDYRSGTFGSTITWLYDGQVVEGAENSRSVTVTAGTVNTETKIEAVLYTPSGEREVLSTTFRPVYLDVVIEAQTRVPEFYLGRALPSVGSIVNATVLINDGSSQTDLVYTWQINGQVIEGGPIRGRNQISFVTPRRDSSILSVMAAEPNGTILAQRSILLPSVLPSINFHEVNSLFGLRYKPITDELIMIGSTVTIQAVPYHLDIRVYNNPDIAQWEINNSLSQNQGSNPYQITFKPTGVAKSAKLGFQVRDTTLVLQGASDNIQVRF